MHPPELVAALRAEARDAPESGIVEVFNRSRGRPGLIPLHVGEGDRPTPALIREAAIASLKAGETFYTYQRGLPELRQALADYHARVYGRPFAAERFFVTGGGMQAIQIALRMVAGFGDEVLVPMPAWPNVAAAMSVSGARPVSVPLRFGNRGWTLDLDRLFDAAGARTRAIFINSPANPTGWTASVDEIRAIVEFARQRGLWIVADEVYHRYFYDGERSPSFYDVVEADDRIILANTFSKNWAMTGWRIGWLSAPPSIGGVIGNLIQYSTSGVAAFMQRGAVVALNDGDDTVREQTERARIGREIVHGGLAATGRVRCVLPAGTFYLFFAVDGVDDTRALALQLVDEANVSLAPGTAFGEGGEQFMRLCFARDAAQLTEATDRLATWLQQQ